MVVRAPDLGGCLCGECLGPGLLRNGRVGRNAVVVNTETKTYRVPRTLLERLKLWPRAYETKILSSRYQAVGRGPTPKASQKAAEKRWLAAQSPEKERVE